MKIAVAGTGYVGLSIATLLAQHNQVTAIDIIPQKVDMVNRRQSPIQDEYIEKYFAEKELNLKATLDAEEAYQGADFVVIAAPTNYDPQKNFFDTSAVEAVIDLVLQINPDAVMVIKSTIPVGYCRSLYVKYQARFATDPALQGKHFNLLFSPEFLRESKALYDNLYPSRIIVGIPKLLAKFDEENRAIQVLADLPRLEEAAHTFANLLQQGAIKENIPILFMGLKEAEAVTVIHCYKLSNTPSEEKIADLTGLEYSQSCSPSSYMLMFLSSATSGCIGVATVTRGPNITLSPISMGETSRS